MRTSTFLAASVAACAAGYVLAATFDALIAKRQPATPPGLTVPPLEWSPPITPPRRTLLRSSNEAAQVQWQTTAAECVAQGDAILRQWVETERYARFQCETDGLVFYSLSFPSPGYALREYDGEAQLYRSNAESRRISL